MDKGSSITEVAQLMRKYHVGDVVVEMLTRVAIQGQTMERLQQE